MPMLRQLAAALLLRRLSRDLDRLASGLERHNQLLARLAEHWAPEEPAVAQTTVRQQSGVDFLDATELSLALDYIDRTRRDTGHTPDDEEVLIYLADEKTTDLHKRLMAREQELERLQEQRR